MYESGRKYFEDRIYTAAPERLQFMLLDAALQAARKAEQLLVADRPLQAGVEFSQAESILTEIVSGLRKDAAPQLVDRVASLYAFMIRRLTDAHLNGDVQAVRDALRVLEVEHETWRLLCEREAAAVAPPIVPPPAPHLPPPGITAMKHDDYASGGFSAQA